MTLRPPASLEEVRATFREVDRRITTLEIAPAATVALDTLIGKPDGIVTADPRGQLTVTDKHGAWVNLERGDNGYALVSDSSVLRGVKYAQLDHTTALVNVGTNTHVQIDAHITATADHAAITKAARGIPDRAGSALSFDVGTRTFTITPASGSFDYFISGVKYTVSAAGSIVIADTSGPHWIYYDGATLSDVANADHDAVDDLIVNKVRVGTVYWNATDSTAHLLADERHGPVMSGETQEWFHNTIGAVWHEGLALSGYTLDTDSDAGVDFEVSDGKIHDEDLGHDIVDGAPATQYAQQLNGGNAEIPIAYRDDVDGTWTQDAATTLPYKRFGAGRLAYNKDDGDGTFSQVEVTNNRFVLATLVATNDWQYPIKMVQGQAEYTDKKTAVEEANAEQIAWGTMLTPEIVPLYRLVMETGDGLGGTNKCKIVSVMDLRRLSTSGGLASPAEPHAMLSNTHSDSVAAAVVRGGLQVGNATPAWDLFSPGAAGTFLRSAGAGADLTWDNTVATHIADTTDPHGSTMSVSVQVSTPKIYNPTSITLDAFSAGGPTSVSVTNSHAGQVANLSVEGAIFVGGTVDGRDVDADGTAQDNHIADTTDPHGAAMSVSNYLLTPKIVNYGNLVFDAYSVGADTTVYVYNSDATGQADLSVQRNIIVGGTIDGRDLQTDGTKLDGIASSAVAAHAMLDGSSHTDSVAQGVTRGSIIIGNITPAWDELVIGANPTYLFSDGADPSWAALDISHDSAPALGGDLNCNGSDLRDTSRAYVQITDQLYVTQTVGIAAIPRTYAGIFLDPSGSTIWAGMFGGCSYSGASAVYGLTFSGTHTNASPASHTNAYGCLMAGEIEGVAAANKILKSRGGALQAINSGAQDQATASSYAYSVRALAARPGFNVGISAGNFYGYSLFVEDATAALGTPTTSQEWCALFEGDVQINSGKKLILEGSASSQGDSYIVWNAANSHIEFWIDGVLEGYVDGAGFNNT